MRGSLEKMNNSYASNAQGKRKRELIHDLIVADSIFLVGGTGLLFSKGIWELGAFIFVMGALIFIILYRLEG